MYMMYAVKLFEVSKHLIRSMEVDPILNVQYLLFRDVCGSTDTKVVGLTLGPSRQQDKVSLTKNRNLLQKPCLRCTSACERSSLLPSRSRR